MMMSAREQQPLLGKELDHNVKEWNREAYAIKSPITLHTICMICRPQKITWHRLNEICSLFMLDGKKKERAP